VRKRQVGFVFQHYALFRHMTVASNIAFGLRIRPWRERPPREKVQARVRELMKLVQLDGLEHRYPAQLSGGQRQRVALARALAVEPRVLLLDEPFGALDAKVRRDLRRWLREIHSVTGVTTVFVTHDQEEALELADRVAILNQGRIEQVGSADAIHDDPASPFVMSFIGETSRLVVDVRQGAVWHGASRLPIPGAGFADGHAQLFLRPWDLCLTDEAQASLKGEVVAVRRAANAQRLDVRLDGCNSIVELATDLTVPMKAGCRVGANVLAGRLYETPAG